MRIPLDRQSETPLYQQIKTYLRQGILSGSLAPDTPDLAEALQLGAAGFWLDERIFAVNDPAVVLQALRTLLHAPVVV